MDAPVQLVLYEEESEVLEIPEVHEQIFVDLVGEDFLIFKSNYVDILWDKYRIVADSIDEDLNEYGSKHLPAILLPEQVQVLLESGFIQIRRVASFDTFTTPVVAKPRDFISEEEKVELTTLASRIVCGQIIKDRKRKATDGDGEIPAKKMRVTHEEVNAELQNVTLDEEVVNKVVDELLSKRSAINEKVVNIEHEAPSSFYEILELDQIPFPTTNEYRIRVTVFRDLWRKGLFLTSGIKFGCHYLAYEASPSKVHSKYMVFCRSPTDAMTPFDLTGISRVGSQVKKKILLSVVSSDTLIPYYMKLSWWKGQK